MVVKEYENARAYLNDHEAILLEQEAVSQLVLYNAYQNKSIVTKEKSLFGVVMQEDSVVLHFSNVESHNMAIHVSNQNKEIAIQAAALLADYFVGNHISFAGLNARNDICHAFIDQYKKNISCNFLEKLGTDIMEIREVNDIKPVEGTHRLATMDDVNLITDWMIQFKLEALASEINFEDARSKATKFIEENKVYIYEDMEQNIVSMAAASRRLMHGVAISYVFTPEVYRGKGYAAANVYYMCKELLEQGNEFCTLFVDKKNPLTTRAYEMVGFHALEENYNYALVLT